MALIEHAMSRQRILVIEDEIDILEVVEYNLQNEGFAVLRSLDGEGGFEIARDQRPDLILLDLMLPGMSGLEVCRRLKQDELTREIPVIMLTARAEESDVIVGLGLGADDYVTKPFRPRELCARVVAVLRRAGAASSGGNPDRVRVGGLLVDARRHEILVDDAPVVVTATEFKILQLFAGQPGRVFTREQIAAHAMGKMAYPGDRNIDVHIKSIRKKLGPRRELIETVRGVGYRLADPRTA